MSHPTLVLVINTSLALCQTYYTKARLNKLLLPLLPLITSTYTHAFSGSMNQSDSHSHPLGGMKYSFFSFNLPVTSENLWRPTSPVVPQFPKTLAWFSYCNTVKGPYTKNYFIDIDTLKFIFLPLQPQTSFYFVDIVCQQNKNKNQNKIKMFTSSANTLNVPSENVLNLFSCAERPSHILTLIWTGTFDPLVLSIGY